MTFKSCIDYKLKYKGYIHLRYTEMRYYIYYNGYVIVGILSDTDDYPLRVFGDVEKVYPVQAAPPISQPVCGVRNPTEFGQTTPHKLRVQ